MRIVNLAVAAGLLALPGMAAAHARLVSSTPASGAAVAAPAAVDLHFSETVIGKLSGAEIAAAGAAAAPVKASVGPDGKSLHLAFPRPLASGSYVVTWHVVSADTHRVSGRLPFRVR